MAEMKSKAVYFLLLVVVVIMGTVFFTGLRWKLDWQPENFVESDKFLANTERGFYNMKGIRVSDETPVSDWFYESAARGESCETLELFQVHIGDYPDREISSAGMAQIRKAFAAYADRETPVRLIVRFLYDWDGNGSESDPASIDIVLRHMEQAGEILKEYEDLVYIVQGVFVGSWAEMHGSRYLTEKSYLTLIEKMHEIVPESAFLAVRTPAYWRMAAGRTEPLQQQEAWNMSDLASRLSLFNDGILGNWLDCGTYGDIPQEEAQKPGEHWIREDELAFQEQLNLYVPNGGEVVLENELNDLESADEALRTMHISYLNNRHDMQVLEKWKNTIYSNESSVYDGMNGYDYIERHLGYRFVIRSAAVKEKGFCWEDPVLNVEIENVGYAPRYTPCRVEVTFKNQDTLEEETVTVKTDVRQWRPGEHTSFEVTVPDIGEGTIRISLRVTGVQDGREILFANENITAEDGSCFVGTIKKGE